MAVRVLGRSPRGYGSLDSSSVNVDVETVRGSDTDKQDGLATDPRPCVSFHDVTYTVSVSTWRCRARPKTILRSASGLLFPGVNAIMGPTGSGKTTLLDILAGRRDKSGLSGVVLVNGEPQPKNFKCLSGYVTQDDVVMGTLTVRENLHFSAALRLPSHMTRQQRRERVEKVVGELGLTDCVDTKIGTEFFRGVSGGERKRTSIGMELIIEPQVLFLDEPTTGLDARTAVSVIQLLKQLCTVNDRIIILSIHQPRYSIFKLFDTLTLLSRGDTVYHGPSNMALDYFHRHGFVCEEHENPADYFLDVVSICESQDSAFDAGYDSVASNPQAKCQEVTDLATTYQSSEEYSKVMEKVEPMVDCLRDRETALKRSNSTRGTYARNPLWQFFVVTRRSAVDIVRNPMTSIFQMINSTVLAIVIGIVYIKSTQLTKDNMENVFNNRLGAIFLLVMGQVFGNLSAIELFIKQRALFIHENAGGYYRVSAYFISKVVTDIITLRIIPTCAFSVIVYFMIGLQTDPSKFFIFLLGLNLTSLTGSSIVFTISAVLKVFAAANLLTVLIYVLAMLFAGFLVALSSLPVWIRWCKWLSMFRYGVEALAINEFSGHYCYGYNNSVSLTFECSNSLPSQFAGNPCVCVWSPESSDICCSGTRFLDIRGFETSTDWIWWDMIALLGLITFFMVLAYIALRLIKKEK